MTKANIMVVEDEVLVAKDISTRLKRMGYHVAGSAGKGNAAIELALQLRPDLILMDINLRDDIDGIEAAAVIHKSFDVPVIYCTAYSNDETLQRAKITDPYGYILKPFDDREMEITIEIALYKHRAEKALRETKGQLDTTLSNISDAVIATDAQGKVFLINSVAEELIKVSASGVRDMPIVQLLELKHIENSGANIDLESTVLGQGEDLVAARQYLVQRDGSEVPVEVSTKLIKGGDDNAEAMGMVVSLRDISQQLGYEGQIRRNAFYDSLTRLPNRALFLDRVSHAIYRAKQAENYEFAVLFVGLDHFRGINEGLGHEAGDQLIVEVSRRMERAVSRVDTLSRFGGDTFAVLLEDKRSLQEAIATCEKIQLEFDASFDINSRNIDISSTIGLVLGHEQYETPEDMLRDADTALHRAKDENKGSHTVFNQEMYAKALRDIDWAEEMKQALVDNSFQMHYQPIVSPATGQIVALEALIRWQSPTYGQVSPEEFIPVAEASGLILPLGQWILETVCHQIRYWQDHHQLDIKVEVNLSGVQFGQPDLAASIEVLLEKTGVPARLLGLEITEGVAMRDVELSVRTLQSLRELGLSVSIDDFGTGYSSLAYLKRYPITTLKIDRSFVMDLTSNTSDQAIARSIIGLARALDLKVLAEGVETAEQLAFLMNNGCDYIQGYYYSQALPAKEVVPYLVKEQLLPAPPGSKSQPASVVSALRH
jgi:diguanylate cyclase (GGDEF)-like protein/PAS domain S-box-containing protein